MIGISFNDGWEYRPRTGPFAALMGPTDPFVPVTLPHDAMLAAGRDAESSRSGAIAYFRTGAYEYRKTFDVPEDWRSKSVWLRFEGVYRSAFVFLNGELVGHRPNGYSELTIELGAHAPLRRGERDPGRGPHPRRLALVLGRWHLPERHPARQRPGARGARRRPDHDPRHRCRPRRRRGRDDGGQRHHRPPSRPGPHRGARCRRRRRGRGSRAPHGGPDVVAGRAPTGDGDPSPSLERRRPEPLLVSRAGARRRRAARRGPGRRSASGRCRSIRRSACGSTATRSTSAAPASTTTTASSARPRSPGPTSAGSSSSRTPGSTPSAAPTTRSAARCSTPATGSAWS